MSTNDCPFLELEPSDKRLKLFLWGDTGTAKTTLALSFPRPAVIDLEGGTDHYRQAIIDRGGRLMQASTSDEVMRAIDWLLKNKHEFRTLVIDPISVYWDSLQKAWGEKLLKARHPKSKGHHGTFYELQPTDWQLVKGELRTLVRKLTALDMSVIVTAREKPLYSEADGEMMKKIGMTFDGEKGLPYLFDTVVRLYRDDSGRFLGRVVKDRTRKLPTEPFRSEYAVFERVFGSDALTREAKPSQEPTEPPAAPEHRPAQPPASNGANGAHITPNQLTKLWATAREKWKEDANDRVRQMLIDLRLPTSTKDIPRARFEAALNYIESDGATTESPPGDREPGSDDEEPGYIDSMVNGGA